MVFCQCGPKNAISTRGSTRETTRDLHPDSGSPDSLKLVVLQQNRVSSMILTKTIPQLIIGSQMADEKRRAESSLDGGDQEG